MSTEEELKRYHEQQRLENQWLDPLKEKNNTLTEEVLKEHYEHKCNTGYDPLLCVHLIYYPHKLIEGANGQVYPVAVKNLSINNKHEYSFVDKIITQERYVDLIQRTKTESIDMLGDVDIIQTGNVWLPGAYADKEEAAIFWLKPTSSCKTLQDLFNVYQKRIINDFKEIFKKE